MMSRLLHAKLKRKEHETQRAAAAYSGRENRRAVVVRWLLLPVDMAQ